MSNKISLDDVARNKLVTKYKRILFKFIAISKPEQGNFFLNARSKGRLLEEIKSTLKDYTQGDTTTVFPLYGDFTTQFSHARSFTAAVLLKPEQMAASTTIQVKHIHTCWWAGYYAIRMDLVNQYQEQLPASFRKYDSQIRSQTLWTFLSLALNHVPKDEPIFQWIKNNEDFGVLKETSMDMPVYQFMRWMLEFWQSGGRPDYQICSQLYQQVDQYWEDETKLAEVICDILDHHLILLEDKNASVTEHATYYPDQYNPKHRTGFVPMWQDDDVLPLEILALRRLRLHLGLNWPEIRHPLNACRLL